jgi:carbamoyltransferase
MKTSDDWILAIGGSEHDLSAALARGCDIRVAIEQERLSRRKHGMSHWYESPIIRSIEYCLADQDIDLRQVTRAVASDSVPARIHRDLCGLELRQFRHHLCHAAAAAMMLPAGSRSGILVCDGYGSIRGPAPESLLRNLRETFSFYTFGPEGYQCFGSTFGIGYIEQDEFPIGVTNSIGMLYELVTGLLGYDLMDSGKTMGLSSYGVPRYLDVLERFVQFGDSPSSPRTIRISPPLSKAFFAMAVARSPSGRTLLLALRCWCTKHFCTVFNSFANSPSITCVFREVADSIQWPTDTSYSMAPFRPPS